MSIRANMGREVQRLNRGVTRKNLRSEGFDLDGSDESTAMLAMIAADSPGVIYTIPDGATLGMGGTQLAIDGKPHTRIEGYEGSTIQWTSVPTLGGNAHALIYATDSDHFGMDNVVLDGAETSFIDTNSNRYGLFAYNCADAKISRLTISGTSRGARIDTCDRAVITEFDYTGFLTSEAGISLANYHTTLLLWDTNDIQLSHIFGRNCGSVLVPGPGCSRGMVSQLHGRNIFDNGIYLSETGDGWMIDQFSIINDSLTANNTGAKILGSQHTVTNFHIENMGGGIVIGGHDTDQGDGYTGHGTKVLNGTLKNIGGIGAYVTTNGGGTLGPRDFTIAFLDIDSCASFASTNSSFLVDRGHHLQILFNTVQNHLGTVSAYHFLGSSGNPLVGIQAIGNKTRNASGGASVFGLYANWVDDMLIDGQTLHNISASASGMRLENANNCTVTRTRKLGTAGTSQTIRVQSGTGNRVTNNPGCVISDAGTSTVKPQTYAASNVTTDRTYDANSTTLDEVADVLGSLIADLRAQGWVL